MQLQSVRCSLVVTTCIHLVPIEIRRHLLQMESWLPPSISTVQRPSAHRCLHHTHPRCRPLHSPCLRSSYRSCYLPEHGSIHRQSFSDESFLFPQLIRRPSPPHTFALDLDCQCCPTLSIPSSFSTTGCLCEANRGYQLNAQSHSVSTCWAVFMSASLALQLDSLCSRSSVGVFSTASTLPAPERSG